MKEINFKVNGGIPNTILRAPGRILNGVRYIIEYITRKR